jgi:hypothetical protein
MALQHLRSSTADKRPTPAAMSDGQLAVNTNAASTGLFFKDSAGALIKVGPVHVGTTAPNASPAVGGETGNTVGEQWLDTTGGTYVFKVWDGSAWRSEAAGGASVTTSDSAPVSPSDGDLWYDSVGGRLYVYYDDGDTSQWVDAAPQGGGGGGASVTVSETAPTSPTAGDLWFDNTTTDARLYIYYDDGNTQQWIDAAPAGAGGGGAGGKILQVVRSHIGGKASTTSTSLTKLATSASITPSSTSSKILITISTGLGNADTGNANFSIVRTVGGADTNIFNNVVNKQGATTGYQYDAFSWTDLDSPSTTSAVTYSLSALRVDGNATPFAGGRNTDTAYTMGVMFILSEVAA